MSFIAWIVLGLIAGAIAKAIMPGNDPGGIIVTMIIGIVGAVIGGFLGSTLMGAPLTGFSVQSLLLAIVGSLLLLWIYRMATKSAFRAGRTLKLTNPPPAPASGSSASRGVRASTWSSVFIAGAGAPGGVSGPWARTTLAMAAAGRVRRRRLDFMERGARGPLGSI